MLSNLQVKRYSSCCDILWFCDHIAWGRSCCTVVLLLDFASCICFVPRHSCGITVWLLAENKDEPKSYGVDIYYLKSIETPLDPFRLSFLPRYSVHTAVAVYQTLRATCAVDSCLRATCAVDSCLRATCAVDSCLQGSDAVSLDEWFPILRRTLLPSSLRVKKKWCAWH